MRVIVPPIKSQGIKTKLVPWINDTIARSGIDVSGRWIEPFFGTGVVGFNSLMTGPSIVGDTNPHIINFYNGLKDKTITKFLVRDYLEDADRMLKKSEDDGTLYYKEVRKRFNSSGSPLDFLFLSRAGFNGMIRFNRKGEWNIPFCKKRNRFQPAYVTKICNQVECVSEIIQSKAWSFANVSFERTLENVNENDMVYCDPPYYGRYDDFYNGWSEQNEITLFEILSSINSKFILSTWHHNQYRKNEMIDRLWGKFNIYTREHYYHSGANIENRHPMVEALVCNFEMSDTSNLLLYDGDLIHQL